MTKKWRLILDDKCDGFYNMAVDEAIFFNYPHRRIPTLRIYGWKQPFISLGYNQKADDVLTFKEDISFVRRMTGGATIFHDQEITYSVVCSIKDLDLPKAVKDSYKILCSFLKSFYNQLGIGVSFAADILFSGLGEYGNFCFSSFQHYDFIIGKKKIGGNAQRRKKDLIFQHGSIPQEIDPNRVESLIKDTGNFREKTTSLNEVLGKNTQFYKLRALLAESFISTFGVKLSEDRLCEKEQMISRQLLERKYRLKRWNIQRQFAEDIFDEKIGL